MYYTLLWRNKYLPESNNMHNLIQNLLEGANKLKKMQELGVKMKHVDWDYYYLYTTDKEVASQFGMDKDLYFNPGE